MQSRSLYVNCNQTDQMLGLEITLTEMYMHDDVAVLTLLEPESNVYTRFDVSIKLEK